MNMYIFHKNLPQLIYILALFFPKKIYRSYHLRPSTKGVYPVQLTDADYVDFHGQNFI